LPPELTDLFDRPGPFATVCLATPAAIDNAAFRDEVRWIDARRRLQSAGAPDQVLDAMEAVIPDAHLAGDGLVMVADNSGVAHVEHAPAPPHKEMALWDALPALSPIINWRQHQPPYVVVLVDHTGADLFASGSGVKDQHVEAGGESRYPLARNAPGGWSQRRYQQRAINNWAHNAAEVAVEVSRLVEEVGPDIVLAGGDPRALELLMAALPNDLRDRVQIIQGTRAADGGEGETGREVSRAVATAAAQHSVTLLRELREHLGRGDRAVEGVEPTLGALRQAQVAVLLLHDDTDDDRRAWFGAEPNVVARRRADIEGVGSGDIRDGRLIDVALRAAAGTGAAMWVVPSAGPPRDNLGALLRWNADSG
jgi:hypothetical protein